MKTFIHYFTSGEELEIKYRTERELEKKLEVYGLHIVKKNGKEYITESTSYTPKVQ